MTTAQKSAARAPRICLTQHGHLHIDNLMHLFDCSRQTIYVRIRNGTLPKPDGKDGSRPYWLTQTILPFFVRSDAA
jgi:predicted DNA-binding transcriptional regulator AlpA